MTDLSGTAEDWALAAATSLKDAFSIGEMVEERGAVVEKYFSYASEDEISAVLRRLDPAEPLRRELREAHRLIRILIERYERQTGGYLPRTYEAPALDWLARNAAFGAGEVGR